MEGLKKNISDNPDLTVVLKDEYPVQRAEEEVKPQTLLKVSGEIIKKRKMNFSKEEECTILGQQMFTDQCINMVQGLLSKQFPKISPFQDTVIGKNYLADFSLHWVCVANMESRKKYNEIHYL